MGFPLLVTQDHCIEANPCFLVWDAGYGSGFIGEGQTDKGRGSIWPCAGDNHCYQGGIEQGATLAHVSTPATELAAVLDTVVIIMGSALNINCSVINLLKDASISN